MLSLVMLGLWSMLVNVPCAIDKNMHSPDVGCHTLWQFGQVD